MMREIGNDKSYPVRVPDDHPQGRSLWAGHCGLIILGCTPSEQRAITARVAGASRGHRGGTRRAGGSLTPNSIVPLLRS
jgi:hypothetical protein